MKLMNIACDVLRDRSLRHDPVRRVTEGTIDPASKQRRDPRRARSTLVRRRRGEKRKSHATAFVIDRAFSEIALPIRSCSFPRLGVIRSGQASPSSVFTTRGKSVQTRRRSVDPYIAALIKGSALPGARKFHAEMRFRKPTRAGCDQRCWTGRGSTTTRRESTGGKRAERRSFPDDRGHARCGRHLHAHTETRTGECEIRAARRRRDTIGKRNSKKALSRFGEPFFLLRIRGERERERGGETRRGRSTGLSARNFLSSLLVTLDTEAFRARVTYLEEGSRGVRDAAESVTITGFRSAH
jgi:hypothetical protein